jgi:hypothetical protein
MPDEGGDLLLPRPKRYAVTTGALTGTIVGGCEYEFRVHLPDGTPAMPMFRAPVPSGNDPITFLELYRTANTAPPPGYTIQGLIDASLAEALPDYQTRDERGEPDGYASLDAEGKIPIEQLPGAGAGGDMFKAEYDTNDDGKVDVAESADAAPWLGITGKPATFPPSGHAASHGSAGGDPVTPAAIGAATAGHTHGSATTGAPGFMSAADKAKIDGLAAVALSGSYNDLSDAPAAPPVGYDAYCEIEHTVGPSVQGGTFLSGDPQVCPLNLVVMNNSGLADGVLLTGNTITVVPGGYYFTAWKIVQAVNIVVILWHNVEGEVPDKFGPVDFASNSSSPPARRMMQVNGFFTAEETLTFQLQGQCSQPVSGFGFGDSYGAALTPPQDNTYTRITIFKK